MNAYPRTLQFWKPFQRAIFLLTAILLTALCSPAASPGGNNRWTLIGWNNLGMHCMDEDYSVFSLLPPYNTINAQLIDNTGALVRSGSGISVTYEAFADPSGSINTTSAGKTNFWDFSASLFGANLAADRGLAGFGMPGASNTPQAMPWDNASRWFGATGIPITPIDDQGRDNMYPMMKLVARATNNTVLAQAEIVLPVSSEMNCRACHSSSSGPAAQPASGWVNDRDPKRDYRLNVLKLHDERFAANPTFQAALAAMGYNAAGLHASVVHDNKSVLCASCHSSEALGTGGYPGVPPLTRSMHSLHANVINPTNGLIMDAVANRTSCYQCHPGSATRCLRGAMGSAVAADGSMLMQCQSCHGSMSDVGSATRTGWLDEPNCQACHTGNAVSNSGKIRFTSAFDAPGHLRVPANRTFATNADTPAPGKSLYRFSTGHGGLQCSACHGSTHAELPSAGSNDNIQSKQIQGHTGVLTDCTACHANPATINGGPHGMHPVGASWVGAHADALERTGAAACQVCHGADYRGTVISRAKGDRVFSTELGTKQFWRGFQIGCYSCHNGPGGPDAGSAPAAPVVKNASMVTGAGSAASIVLTPSPVTAAVRIVSQPQHGTVGLVGTRATYYPEAGYTGTDAFTFAARDASNSVDSNLGTVSVTIPVSLIWAGDGVANLWNTTAANWTDGTNAAAFRAGSAVLFDDTGSITPAVTLVGSLAPSAVTVDAASNYTFAGSGVLTGAMALTKSGRGALTIRNASNYTGPTAVTAGVLNFAGSLSNSNIVEIATAAKLNLMNGRFSVKNVHIAPGASMSGYGAIAGALLNEGTVQGSGGTLAITGSAVNNNVMSFPSGAVLAASGRFVNNCVLYLRAGVQRVPAVFVNNGVVLDTASTPVTKVAKTGAALRLTYNSQSGAHYQLQRSDSFAPGLWHNIGAVQTGTGALLTIADPVGAAAAMTRYYRIVRVP